MEEVYYLTRSFSQMIGIRVSTSTVEMLANREERPHQLVEARQRSEGAVCTLVYAAYNGYTFIVYCSERFACKIRFLLQDVVDSVTVAGSGSLWRARIVG